MADEPPSALLRRQDQLKRWEESDTNKTPATLSEHNKKVKFQDGCIFLAACSSGDCDEVLRLLDKNADINTANIDGLTALHQACIDDNLDMVEFLVDHGADVDVCDNEGWTPLHATASCGFTEIARYLLRIGANVAAVNNDGDLPLDICEDGEMEALLQEEMDKQGVDADAARSEEENQMLADANKWLSNKSVKEKRHPKTGATALHVACAKGYMKVISVLVQAGSDINAKDGDGWSPLHAAAHWGQEEACKVLAEHMCDMDIKNNAGQTSFDVADTEIIKLLEELKAKQATLKDTADVQNEIIQHRGQHQKRSRSDSQRPVTTITNIDQPDNDPRSSVTRMSGDQKQSVTLKTKERGDATLIHQTTPENVPDIAIKSSSSSEGEGEESSESETEKQNAINNQTSGVNKVLDKPTTTTTVEIQKPEMPKIDEKGESGQNLNDIDTQNEADKVEISIKDQVPRIERIGDGDNQLTAKEKEQDKEEKESDEKKEESNEPSEKEVVAPPVPSDEGQDKALQGRQPIFRSLSTPEPTAPAQEQVPTSTNEISKPTNAKEIPSWRAGLRKTGSTSQVTGSVTAKESETDKALLRSASSPRLDNNNQDKTGSRVFFPSVPITETSDTRSTDRYGSQYGRSTTTTTSGPYRRPTSFAPSSSYQSAYIPYYTRQQETNERREREKELAASAANSRLTGSTTPTSSSPGSSMSSSVSSTSSSNITSPYSNYQFSKRSYEPPKRDEEAETLRKARAKRARETRRSTQGVTLEDIQQAERDLKSVPSKSGYATTTGATTTTSSTTSSTADDKPRVPEAGSQKDSERVPSLETTKKEVSASEDTTVPRRRTLEERREDDTRSSYRKSRDTTKDYSTDAYIPRRDRNALSTSEGSSTTTSSLSSGSGLSRTSSLRNRIRNGELESRSEEKEERQKETKDDSQEKSHDLRTIRARRTRKERRSTGIVSYDAKNDDEDEKEEEKVEKKEDKKETEDKGSYRHRGQYSSTSDVGDKYSSRPSSYVDHYQSTPSLDSNYKKLYEDEKYTTERLRKELERTKKELLEAKAELDRLVKRTEANKAADSNDKREKRALERKLSEMEEELKKMNQLKDDNKRLKDENGALIRVISKLSK